MDPEQAWKPPPDEPTAELWKEDPSKAIFDPLRSVRRLVVIDVMNFLHKAAESAHPQYRRPPEDTLDYLDALDLAALLYFFLRRSFDVRAVIPRSARYRAKNGYLFDIYYCMGLLVYADNCYDDLPTIDIASRRHGVIVSCDKYRDILALQIGSNKRRLLEERVICPTLTPFKAPDGAMVTKLANGDMVVHFLTHLTVESHTQLYSHPDSLDFACVAYFRAAFTPTRRAKLLANLDEVFEFVPRVTALADDNEYVRQIADYKNVIVDRWRAECCFKRIDEVTYSWAQRYQPFQS